MPLLPHRLSFYDQLPMKHRRKRTRLNPNLNVGAFGRMDMGLLVDAMRSELLSPDTGRPLGETEWDAQPYAETLSRMALSGDVDVRELPSMVARSHQAMLVTFSSDNSLSHFPGFLFG